jgi:pimeloyl-ACP methyl ester carboxylesterase
MAELALKQATIEYEQFGPQDSAHPPVLFVHGILVDGRLWRDVAENLARRGFRCIVPTWPLGSHTIPVNEATALSLPGVAEIIKDAIVVLDLSDVTLVGSDTGGGLCQLVVDAYPDRIGRLVLTTATPSTNALPTHSTSRSACFAAPSRSRRSWGHCGCGRCATLRLATACSSTSRIRTSPRPGCNRASKTHASAVISLP